MSPFDGKKKLIGLYKFITIIMSVYLLGLFVVCTIIHIYPIDTPIKLSERQSLSVDRFIIVPGEYTLALVVNRKVEGVDMYKELNKIFGTFCCWNNKKNSPCGDYVEYEIDYEITNNKEKINGFISSRNDHVDWVSLRECAIGNIVNLSFGNNFIEIKKISGLSALAKFDTKIVLRPGADVKSSQNRFTGWITLISLPSFFILFPINLIMLILYSSMDIKN